MVDVVYVLRALEVGFDLSVLEVTCGKPKELGLLYLPLFLFGATLLSLLGARISPAMIAANEAIGGRESSE